MTMEKLVTFLKTTGYVYQGSEIYGGLPMRGITVRWESN